MDAMKILSILVDCWADQHNCVVENLTITEVENGEENNKYCVDNDIADVHDIRCVG